MTDLRQQLEHTLGGAYTLGRELGGGGMSRVFVADEVRLGRKVVVKVLSPELAAGISAERFEREIKLAASLQQANIVPVLSAGDTNGLPFYTMPFVDGESLRARLGRGTPLTITEVLRILGDVSRALQYAHEHGIVHRDIKPDNVLLSGGTAVVTDFGIAKAISASRASTGAATLTQMGTSIGTPAYMAPEQAAGDPDIDARADIYAFGCTAYELLAGRPPFHGRTPQRVLAAHLGETPQPIGELRSDVPLALADLVMRCLAKEPARRPQSAGEMARTLDGVTSGGGMDAVPRILSSEPAAFRKALLLYVVAAAGVGVVAKAATIVIGLPDWVFPGALLVMAAGLPVILVTGYVQAVTRRALLSTPQVTPGGGTQQPSTMATLALKAGSHLSWKRTMRGGMLAVGSFAAIVIAFMVMRAFGIGPAGSLFGAGTLKARDRIMIADFGANRTDTSVASVVAEAVRTNLSQSSSIVLATPTSIAAALRRMQKPANSRLDIGTAREVATRQGYKAIVTGDVTGLGSGFVIALRLVTADSGAVLAAYQTTVNGPADLVAGVDVIAKKLRGKIGESLRSVQASPPLAQVSTASLEALKAYTLGNRAADVDRQYGKAAEYLRQAVAIDSNFAGAWRKLAVVMRNAGAPASSVDSAITRAHTLRDHLTETERLLTDAYYYTNGPGRDRAKGLAAYDALMKLGDTATAGNNAGLLLVSRREFARAETLFRASIRANPDLILAYGNLVAALAWEGKAGDIDPVLTEMRRRAPTNEVISRAEFHVAYNTGRTSDASHIIDSLAKLKNSSWGRFRAADLAMLHGQLHAADRWLAEGFAVDSAAGLRQLPGEREFIQTRDELWFSGPTPEAVRRLDSLAPSLTTARAAVDRSYADLAATYALADQPAKARAMLARIRTEVTDTALIRTWEPEVHIALGAIAVAERRASDAVAEYAKGDRLPDGPARTDARIIEVMIGRAFDYGNQPDSAIAYYERFVNEPAGTRISADFQWLAGVYKRLGELYEAKGDKTKAESYLTKFVELWDKADPALQPRVIEAKQRLARLRDREGR